MGTAIRFLKYEISLIEMEMDLDEVRARGPRSSSLGIPLLSVF